MYTPRIVLWFCLATLLLVGYKTMTLIGISQTLPETVDFNIHIRPILSDRCFKCHGPDANKREGNLRLDIADSAYAELIEYKGQFAIVPGNIHTSVLLKRIKSVDSALIMPPSDSKLKLSSFEIALLEKWIKQGAEYKQHWAFIAPSLPNVPLQKHKWPANDIDRFVLAKMMQQQLNPNGTSDKERLLKRLSMDLIGLPSTLELQDQFLADTTDRGYEKIVDTLLNNPHYGERMALNWLDVARYADSHGYQDDGIRSMWPWRDWVIYAFNQNYSYQQFVSWQLAGDLLPNPTKEMLLATGFNRNHKITEEAGVIDEEYRLEYVTDRTNTFAKTFLAMTFECAKCHDHKYDPIPQKSYFSTFAFFNQVPETGLLTDPFGILYADAPKMKITTEEVTSLLKFINKKDTAAVEVMIMQDSTALRPTHILLRGVYDQLGEVVTASTPTQIFPFDTNQFKQNRLGLAQWLFDKNHPLTARVYVNRIWAQFFGRGLVPTTSDFGMQGEMPTHPELLDWLALDFMNHGWNIKRLVKMIVMSSTYRQSAEINGRKQSQDPDNIYLSRYRRMRVPAELIKDLAMASSGLLNTELGGPSVKPYQPYGLWESATSGRGLLATYIQDHDENLYRRGIYTFIKRTVPPPSMLIFDASNRDQCEVNRFITNTPLQALVTLNDPQMLEAARVLAEKISQEECPIEEKIVKAFRLIIGRRPQPNEKEILITYFQNEIISLRENILKANRLLDIGENKHLTNVDVPATAALMKVIHTLYNLEEAITKS